MMLTLENDDMMLKRPTCALDERRARDDIALFTVYPSDSKAQKCLVR